MSVTPEYPIKRRCDVTDGDEYRYGPGRRWANGPAFNRDDAWVEVRPKRQADPEWLHNGTWPDATGIAGVTTVGQMCGRTDLDLWEYADTEGHWNVMSHVSSGWWDSIALRDGAFPVIVRRNIASTAGDPKNHQETQP